MTTLAHLDSLSVTIQQANMVCFTLYGVCVSMCVSVLVCTVSVCVWSM